MTTYYEIAAAGSGQALDWDTPSVWNQNSVPDSSNDGVILNQLSSPYSVAILAGESYSVGLFQASANQLILAGSLASSGNVSVGGTGQITLQGGSLSATGQIALNGQGLSGAGNVTAGGLLNVVGAVSSSGGNLTLAGGSVNVTGSLIADAGTTLTIGASQAGGFKNFQTSRVDGEMVGGTYQAESGGTLNLKTDSAIVESAAIFTFDGANAAINSFNGSAFVSLQSTLTSTLGGSVLTLDNFDYTTSNILSLDGTVNINNGSLEAYYLAPNGTSNIVYSGHSDRAALISNDGPFEFLGKISAVATAASSTDMLIQNDLAGPGVLSIGAAVGSSTVTVDLEGAATYNVSLNFADNSGTLILGKPVNWGGVIGGFTQGDSIVLKGFALSSVTGYSFANGVLTVDEGGTTVNLNLTGSYTAADFSLTAGSGSSPSVILHEGSSAPPAIVYFELSSAAGQSAGDPVNSYNWNESIAWNRNTVPSMSNDGIIIQATPYPVAIDINPGYDYTVASLQMSANSIVIEAGSLTSLANVNIGGTAQIDFNDGGTLTAGKISVNGEGIIGSGNVIASGAIEVYSQVDANDLGTLTLSAGSIYDSGTLQADYGSTLDVKTNITGSGAVVIGPAVEQYKATVILEAADSASITFADNTGTLVLGTPAQVTGSIHGFVQGDQITVKGFALSAVTGYAYSNGVLAIHEGGSTIDLHFAGSYTTQNFSLTDSGQSSSPSIDIHLVGVAAG